MLVKTAEPVQLGSREPLVMMEQPAELALLVKPDQLEPLERLDHLESKVRLEALVPLDEPGPPDRLEPRAVSVQQD